MSKKRDFPFILEILKGRSKNFKIDLKPTLMKISWNYENSKHTFLKILTFVEQIKVGFECKIKIVELRLDILMNLLPNLRFNFPLNLQ